MRRILAVLRTRFWASWLSRYAPPWKWFGRSSRASTNILDCLGSVYEWGKPRTARVSGTEVNVKTDGIIPTQPYRKYILCIGWVSVGWQRHCTTFRSLLELDNQGTFFF